MTFIFRVAVRSLTPTALEQNHKELNIIQSELLNLWKVLFKSINLSRNTTYYHGQRAITDMQYSRSEANYFCPSYLNPELPRNSSTEETT